MKKTFVAIVISLGICAICAGIGAMIIPNVSVNSNPPLPTNITRDAKQGHDSDGNLIPTDSDNPAGHLNSEGFTCNLADDAGIRGNASKGGGANTTDDDGGLNPSL